ncbi:unnamed protein product [Oncorhynchus mykiss]|uniref:Uncharacterized protein n=1 Tax=Oncorhynchus mykiss TaxID=8022 RepID=A0A060Y3R3_ONCMY|nr:unnamed protein product [Oncorhynchus mykiss]
MSFEMTFSSLADLGIQKKDHQWNEKKLTGGSNWTPQVAPPSWGAPGPMMGGPAPGAPGAPGAIPPPMGAHPGFSMASAAGSGVPMMPPMMMGQPMMGQPMRPPLPGAAAPGALVTDMHAHTHARTQIHTHIHSQIHFFHTLKHIQYTKKTEERQSGRSLVRW